VDYRATSLSTTSNSAVLIRKSLLFYPTILLLNVKENAKYNKYLIFGEKYTGRSIL